MEIAQRKAVTLFSEFLLDFEHFYQKRKGKSFKTTEFEVSYSFEEKISFNVTKKTGAACSGFMIHTLFIGNYHVQLNLKVLF